MPCCVAKRNLERVRKSDELDLAFLSLPPAFVAFSPALPTDTDETEEALDDVAPVRGGSDPSSSAAPASGVVGTWSGVLPAELAGLDFSLDAPLSGRFGLELFGELK